MYVQSFAYMYMRRVCCASHATTSVDPDFVHDAASNADAEVQSDCLIGEKCGYSEVRARDMSHAEIAIYNAGDICFPTDRIPGQKISRRTLLFPSNEKNRLPTSTKQLLKKSAQTDLSTYNTASYPPPSP